MPRRALVSLIAALLALPAAAQVYGTDTLILDNVLGTTPVFSRGDPFAFAAIASNTANVAACYTIGTAGVAAAESAFAAATNAQAGADAASAKATAVSNAFTAADAALSNSYAAADVSLSNALTAADAALSNAFTAADASLSNALTTASAVVSAAADAALSNAFTAADASLSNALTAADAALSGSYMAADASLSNAFTAADAVVSAAAAAALVSVSNTAASASAAALSAGDTAALAAAAATAAGDQAFAVYGLAVAADAKATIATNDSAAAVSAAEEALAVAAYSRYSLLALGGGAEPAFTIAGTTNTPWMDVVRSPSGVYTGRLWNAVSVPGYWTLSVPAFTNAAGEPYGNAATNVYGFGMSVAMGVPLAVPYTGYAWDVGSSGHPRLRILYTNDAAALLVYLHATNSAYSAGLSGLSLAALTGTLTQAASFAMPNTSTNWIGTATLSFTPASVTTNLEDRLASIAAMEAYTVSVTNGLAAAWQAYADAAAASATGGVKLASDAYTDAATGAVKLASDAYTDAATGAVKTASDAYTASALASLLVTSLGVPGDTNAWFRMEGGTNLVGYRVSGLATNLGISYSADFCFTNAGVVTYPPAGSAFPFSSGLWSGEWFPGVAASVSYNTLPAGYWYGLSGSLPVTLTPDTPGSRGTATVYVASTYPATNEFYRAELGTLTNLQAVISGLLSSNAAAMASSGAAALAGYKPSALWEGTNFHMVIEGNTNLVFYRISESTVTNLIITLSDDFYEGLDGTRPAWTNHVFTFSEPPWYGIMDSSRYVLFYESQSQIWGSPYPYDLALPAVLTNTTGTGQGIATVSIASIVYPTQEVFRVDIPALTNIDAFLTNETDLTALRLYHYGSPEIVESPAEWFVFDGVGTIMLFNWEVGRTNVVIPWAIGGVPVTAIGGGAFSMSGIVSVIAPQTVTMIGDSAFSDCSSLTSINLPQATSIGNGAFSGCLSLTSINIPQVTSIVGGAFSECPALTSINLPQATSIGNGAFNDCESLTAVHMGQNAPAEATNVFYGITTPPTVYVTNPNATGWGATWNGAPVVRPGLHTDALVLNGTTYTNIPTTDVSGLATTQSVNAVAVDLELANIILNNHTDNGAIGSDAHLQTGDRALIDSVPSLATTNIVTDAISATYKTWTGTITPVNGTATVAIAHGNMPVLVTDAPCVLTLDTTGYGTAGVSRVSLSYYTGTNSFTFATNIIDYAETPTVDTNGWNSLLIRRVSNGAWKGVGL